MTRSLRRSILWSAAGSLVAGGTYLAGCVAYDASDPAAEAPAVDNSLARLAAESQSRPPAEKAPDAPALDAYAAAVNQDLDRLRQARAQASLLATDSPAPPETAASGDPWLAGLSTDAGAALWSATQHHLATMRAGLIEPAWNGMLAEQARISESPSARVARHAEQIAAIFRTEIDSGDMPLYKLLALSAMEALRPGTLDETVDPMELEMLQPADRAALEAVRRIFGSASPTRNEGAEGLADRVLAAADSVRDAKPMTVHFATLARQVLGYGRYEPFESASFVAGRPQRMIVYTEIDNFAQRPFRQGDAADSADSAYGARWTVELSQELQLYRDGAYVWGRREQSIVETSRNRRHDFFLVHEIELPPTLAVGPYELKIIMRDKTSGDVDEWIVPFRYVADADAAARAE
jgi:hypothetical protein